MKLTLEQIKEITQGTERILETEKGIEFHRFTETEEKVYAKVKNNTARPLSTAGVRMEFETDSKSLYMKLTGQATTSRHYIAIDVLVNGQRIGTLRNSPEDELMGTFFAINKYEWQDKVFEKEFDLGEGVKHVSVYLPWSFVIQLMEFSLDDGAFVKAAPRSKKVLVLGDSITHGFDAVCPSRSYASILTSKLGAEEYNKAIGGDTFVPEFAECLVNREYDYITIAYGTNDWNCYDKEEATSRCEGFLKAIYEKFPKSKVFVIGPIWRADWENDSDKKFGPFADMEKMIFEVASKYDNMICIPGFDLIDHDKELYGDLNVHPNDNGFKQYANRLFECIEKWI